LGTKKKTRPGAKEKESPRKDQKKILKKKVLSFRWKSGGWHGGGKTHQGVRTTSGGEIESGEKKAEILL